jgi:hypothetical protein
MNRAHLDGIVDPLNQFGGLIDNRDVVVFVRQILRDAIANLARATDDDFHRVGNSMESARWQATAEGASAAGQGSASAVVL